MFSAMLTYNVDKGILTVARLQTALAVEPVDEVAILDLAADVRDVSNGLLETMPEQADLINLDRWQFIFNFLKHRYERDMHDFKDLLNRYYAIVYEGMDYIPADTLWTINDYFPLIRTDEDHDATNAYIAALEEIAVAIAPHSPVLAYAVNRELLNVLLRSQRFVDHLQTVQRLTEVVGGRPDSVVLDARALGNSFFFYGSWR